MVYIPTIDFADYDESDDTEMVRLAGEVSSALTQSGFMKIRNLGISDDEMTRAFELSRWFFSRSEVDKAKSAYTSAAKNFGFQGLGIEHLDPARPADIKETFTMRDLKRHDPGDSRWPSVEISR